MNDKSKSVPSEPRDLSRLPGAGAVPLVQDALRPASYAQSMTPDRLHFPDLPSFLANLDPQAKLNSGVYALFRDGASSDLERDLVQWEEGVRWLAGGWDCEEEYAMDMLPRFRLDVWLQKPDTVWTDELWQRLQVADEVYRRRSEAPSRVLYIQNQGYSEEETQRRLALWRAQPVRFWFVWVQPFGLNDPA